MGKRLKYAWVVLLLACGGAFGDLQEAIDNLWFPIGEGLEYRIYWGVIPVATAYATNELIEFNGKTCLAIRIHAKSNDFLSRIYPVHDFLESIIDLETFLPIRFKKVLHEGRYYTDEETTFDHAARKAHWHRLKDGRKEDMEIDADTRDLISFMYHTRKGEQFDKGKKQHYRVMADEKVYDLYVTAEKIEKFRVGDYGWISSLKLEPEASFGGLFVRNKGKMWMWISQDPRRLATKCAAKIPIASINIVISKVHGPGDDFWVKRPAMEEEEEEEQGLIP